MTALWRIWAVGFIGALAVVMAILIAPADQAPVALPAMPPTLQIQTAASGVQARLTQEVVPDGWIALNP